MELENLEAEYRPYYEEGLKSHWEFSQMFGEEDSDSEFSGSESEEGEEQSQAGLALYPRHPFFLPLKKKMEDHTDPFLC